MSFTSAQLYLLSVTDGHKPKKKVSEGNYIFTEMWMAGGIPDHYQNCKR